MEVGGVSNNFHEIGPLKDKGKMEKGAAATRTLSFQEKTAPREGVERVLKSDMPALHAYQEPLQKCFERAAISAIRGE